MVEQNLVILDWLPVCGFLGASFAWLWLLVISAPSKRKLLKMICEDQPIMAIDPGRDRHVFYHRARGTALSLGIWLDKVYILHPCIKSFDRALRLPGRDS